MPEIRLQQKQKAILSAQQILSSQLLQLPLLNLEQRIYDELQENPLLELASENKDTAGDLFPRDDDFSGDELFDSVDRFSKRSLQEPLQSPQSRPEREGRLNFTHESASQERFFQAVQHDSFDETLLRQLTMQEDIGEREAMIAIEILGNLDQDGYFTDEIDVILAGLQRNGIEADESEVEIILHRLPFLDPPHKRYDRLVRKLDISKEDIEEALALITSFDPHPAEVFHDEVGHYITPDFIVTYENGELTAMLNDRSALSVKVSERYQGVLKNRKAPKEEKQFIRYNLIRANDFAAAIAMRRQTLLKVIESLMKAQYAFFVSGPERLLPLGMKAIADDTGLDISTISRAVNGKYVQTRFGVFELKYFFSSSLSLSETERRLSAAMAR